MIEILTNAQVKAISAGCCSGCSDLFDSIGDSHAELRRTLQLAVTALDGYRGSRTACEALQKIRGKLVVATQSVVEPTDEKISTPLSSNRL